MHVKAGIHFTPDPAFKGHPRELTAEDYVYSLKRWLDPNSKRGGAPITAALIVGGREALDEAKKSGRWDLDRPIEGLRALDRYTLQLKLTEPNYPVIEGYLTLGAVAREFVEARGGDLRTYAVGTGAYRLKEFKRGSRIVLEANPDYRGRPFPASGAPGDQALEAAMRGAPFPRIGRIELEVIEEETARLLEFDRGNLDTLVLRSDIASRLLEHDALRPEYRARGIGWQRTPEPFTAFVYFNLRDPLVGGMDAPRVALRRAVGLALDRNNMVDVIYGGQALPANQLVPPDVVGHDPKIPPLVHDPAAARALLDRYGYKRGADGYRATPDGKPLVLDLMLRSGSISREVQTLFRKNMDAIGVRTQFTVAPFQDAIKDLVAGHFQMWFGGFGGNPTGQGILAQLYGKSSPQINVSQFKMPEYDAALDRFMRTNDPAQQVAAARTMSDIARAYAPMIPVVFRLENHFVQPWLLGYRPNRFDTFWQFLDIDLAKRPPSRKP
jgi:ABC-type transport system substrate-binding protein